jgi:hypothetical protein
VTQGAHTADYCAVFAEARAERMAFHNPLQNQAFTQAIYLARTVAAPVSGVNFNRSRLAMNSVLLRLMQSLML